MPYLSFTLRDFKGKYEIIFVKKIHTDDIWSEEGQKHPFEEFLAHLTSKLP